MSRQPENQKINRGLILCLVYLTLFCSTTFAQNTKKVILEVSITGKGMTMPSFGTVVFFRLHDDGQLYYERRIKDRYLSKTTRLKHADVVALIQLAESPDFANGANHYAALETSRDAQRTTTVTYSKNGFTKRVVIINYQPTNPEAQKFYPTGLINLLDKVTLLRPKSEFEMKYGLNLPSVPYVP